MARKFNFKLVITNLAGGGAEKVMLSLASALQQANHDVELILLENYIEHEIPSNVRLSIISPRLQRGWLGKRLLAYKLKKHLAAQSSADLLISALPFANEVAVMTNSQNHWCHIDNTLGVEIKKLTLSNPSKARRRLERYQVLYNARPLIAISQGMLSDLRETIKIRSRIEVIANPFNFNILRQQANEKPLGLPQQPYVIHVGRFNTQKRHDLLLDAWAKIASKTKHLLVLLVNPNPELTAMIAARGLETHVVIVPFQKNPYPWIKNASCLVLSSDHEGLPGVLIESLGIGTPVIATDCPSGPREILGDNNPYLIPCNDAEALAAAMQNLLQTEKNQLPHNYDVTRYATNTIVARYERLAEEAKYGAI